MEIPNWAYGVPPVSVIGDRFCFPYATELTVKKKVKKTTDAHFDVTDSCGNVVLQVHGGVWKFTMKRILRDPAGFPLLTLRGKALTLRHKWKAYEGDGSEKESTVFTVRQSHPVQFKKVLNVFLGSSVNKTAPDFQVSGSFTSLSFKVFQDRRLLAEVKDNFTWESFCKGKENYRIKVYPEVDYALLWHYSSHLTRMTFHRNKITPLALLLYFIFPLPSEAIFCNYILKLKIRFKCNLTRHFLLGNVHLSRTHQFIIRSSEF